MTTPEILGMIDPTITLGNIIEIGAIVVGGFSFLVKMNNGISELRAEVMAMQGEIAKIAEVLTRLAVQETRLNHLDQDVRELQHANRP